MKATAASLENSRRGSLKPSRTEKISMATVPHVPTQGNPRAKYAQLDGVAGIALCDAQGTVSFLTEATGLWQTLTTAARPRLVLCGDLALVEAQRLQDERFGSLLALVAYRNTEHVRTPRAA
jgi:hypothetical protein